MLIRVVHLLSSSHLLANRCMGMGGRERRGVSKRNKNADSGAGTPTAGIASAAPTTSTTTGTTEVKRRASDTPLSKPSKAAKMDSSLDISSTARLALQYDYTESQNF